MMDMFYKDFPKHSNIEAARMPHKQPHYNKA